MRKSGIKVGILHRILDKKINTTNPTLPFFLSRREEGRVGGRRERRKVGREGELVLFR